MATSVAAVEMSGKQEGVAPAAAADDEGPATKRPRPAAPEPERRVCGAFASSYRIFVGPSLNRASAEVAGLEPGSRVQVLWTLAQEDGVEEDVWWSATLEDPCEEGPARVFAWRLRYDACEEHGFGEEVRCVCFHGACAALTDVAEGATMPWRHEEPEFDEDGAAGAGAAACGSLYDTPSSASRAHPAGAGSAMPAAALPRGTRVKARFQGGSKAYAGRVHAARLTSVASNSGVGPENYGDVLVYDILYEADQVLEEGVPAELVEAVPADDSVPGGERGARATGKEEAGHIAAEDFDSFFELAVRGLTSGKAFNRLPRTHQARFAECVRRSRPHFEREVHGLAAERGYGITVTAEDITSVILPRVMPAVVAEFKAVTGSA